MEHCVYSFDHAHVVPEEDLKQLLGGKGFSLWLMRQRLGLPVPPGFTVSTQACVDVLASGGKLDDPLVAQIRGAVAKLEAEIGRSFGDVNAPLLVSVRSGAAASMPGMMDTLLNIGMTPANTRALAQKTGNESFAWGSYHRMLASYAKLVLGWNLKEDRPDLAEPEDSRFAAETLREMIANDVGAENIDNPMYQLMSAVETVFASWNSPRAISYRKRTGMSDAGGTAVNVQAMVFGNFDDRSGTGVAFTRNPSTGAPGMCGDVLFNAQGDDVVSGEARTLELNALEEHMPEIMAELVRAGETLERHFRDLCDIEFTIEAGRLWMLQARIGKRSPAAAPRIAVDMVNECKVGLSRREALERIDGDLLSGKTELENVAEGGQVIAKGLPTSPGVGSGKIVFSPDRAVELTDQGEHIILVRRETSPEDVHGMGVANGIVTTLGGMMSHAAVVARAWGIPAVCSAEGIELTGTEMKIGNDIYVEGDVISIDGGTGQIFRGEVGSANWVDPYLQTLRNWAQVERA